MADQSQKLGDRIEKRVRYVAVFLVVLPIAVILSSDFVRLAVGIFGGEPLDKEIIERLTWIVGTALLWAVVVFVAMGRNLNLHNLVDQWFFGTRNRTDEVIQDLLIKAAERIGAPKSTSMSEHPQKVRQLFYHFANEQEQLRGLAFSYWETYFASMYIGIIGLFAFLFCVIILFLRGIGIFEVIITIIPALLIIFLFLSVKYSLVPKIIQLPNDQIEEIVATNAQELADQIDTRF